MNQPISSRTSRLSGFYQKSVAERTAFLAQWADLTPDQIAALHCGLSITQADKMIENVVGCYGPPLGIGANFVINGREMLIPMVVEEPSVVAAVSFAAKLARSGGGFRTGSTRSIMIAQVQILGAPDIEQAGARIPAGKPEALGAGQPGAGAGVVLPSATGPAVATTGGGLARHARRLRRRRG